AADDVLRIGRRPEDHLIDVRRRLTRGDDADLQTLRDGDQPGRIRQRLRLIEIGRRRLRQRLTDAEEWTRLVLELALLFEPIVSERRERTAPDEHERDGAECNYCVATG